VTTTPDISSSIWSANLVEDEKGIEEREVEYLRVY